MEYKQGKLQSTAYISKNFSLFAMSGVVVGVDVEREPPRRRVERVETLIDQHIPQPIKRRNVGRVFNPRMRRLTGQGVVFGPAASLHSGSNRSAL